MLIYFAENLGDFSGSKNRRFETLFVAPKGGQHPRRLGGGMVRVGHKLGWVG